MIFFITISILAILFFFGRYLLELHPLFLSSVIILGLTTMSFVMPFFSFVFAICMSALILLLSLPFSFFQAFIKKVSSKVLLFLYNTHLLDVLAVINVKFFCVPPVIFYTRLGILASISISHIFFSRWYFIQHTFHDGASATGLTFILLFFGVSAAYLRFLLSFSQFMIPLALQRSPHLLSESVLYVFGENPPNEENPQTPQKRYSLINVKSSRNYYRQYFNASQNNNFKYVSLCVGACAMSAAVAAAYYGKLQAEYSKQQAYDTRREADAAAVDSGLITKEEYWRRHPQDALHKPSDSP